VTLQLLWEEHRAAHPDGHGYSRFCELYQSWKGRLSATMRQTHVAGERLFVDYAGTTLEVIDGRLRGSRSKLSNRDHDSDYLRPATLFQIIMSADVHQCEQIFFLLVEEQHIWCQVALS
jgi:transposase